MSAPHVRPARPEDLGALTALLSDALPGEHFSQELLREKLFPDAWPPGKDGTVLLAEQDGQVIGMQQGVHARDKGWLGLMAVAASARRRGIARGLAQQVIDAWPETVSEIEVLAIPGNYFYPGLDPRLTGALCFVEALGFERFRDCVNLVAGLEHPFPTDAEETRLAAAGVRVRRATPDDDDLLVRFFDAQFGADWLYEARLAFANPQPCLHLALRDGELLGFSAHSTQNRAWGFFGPMGTAPAARGLGIGRVLLWHCLNDLRAEGHRSAVIPWVGPISFYHLAVGAVVERVFWRYRRDRVRKKADH